MAGPLREWNISECAISFAGIMFSGGADGEVLSIEPGGDDFGDVNGADGEVTSFRTNEARATATIKLMQTSQMVAPLLAIRNVDLAALAGAGVGAFQAANLLTGERVEAPQARIMAPPTMGYGRDPSVREFKIRLFNPVFTPGTP